jgi:hypothetical protein
MGAHGGASYGSSGAVCKRFGKRCALRASMGSWGRSSKAVCVLAWVRWPLGNPTVMPFFVGCLLVQWLFSCKKWPVQPESAIP